MTLKPVVDKEQGLFWSIKLVISIKQFFEYQQHTSASITLFVVLGLYVLISFYGLAWFVSASSVC